MQNRFALFKAIKMVTFIEKYFSAIIKTKTRFSLDLGYSLFDLQDSLLSSVYLLSRDRHSSASEIPLLEELNRTGQL